MSFFKIEGLSRKTLIGIFLIKVIAGNLLWAIYTYHYPMGDLNAYFNDGNSLFKILIKDPNHFIDIVFNNDPQGELQVWHSSFENTLYNDSHTMILLNMLFRFFSFGFFEIHIVLINFLSFLGLTALYKTFIKYLSDRRLLLIIGVFLLPSVLFWGSGVLKEGLLLFGLGILLYATDCGLQKSYSWQKILLVLFSVFILLIVKFYVLIALLPGLLANFWISKASPARSYLKYMIVICLFASITFLIAVAKPEYNILKIISNKQQKSLGISEGGVFLLGENNFVRINYFQKDSVLIPAGNDRYRIKSNSSYEAWDLKHTKDTLHVVHSTDTAAYKIIYTVVPPNRNIKGLHLEPTLISFIRNVPNALWNIFAVPSVLHFHGWLEFMSAFENLLYCLLIVMLLFCFKKPIGGLPILYFCLSFVFLIFLLAGFTTPIIGALVRYKTPALPFFMMIVFSCLNKNKLEKLPVIRKLFN